MSVPADAGDASSLKNAFDTIRGKLGNDPEVLLYNASGFTYSTSVRLPDLCLDFSRVGSILDLKPEELQQAFNISAVGALAASQQVRVTRERRESVGMDLCS